MLLSVAFSREISQELTQVVIADALIDLESLVADRALVLPVDDFMDAHLAEGVPTFGDVRVIESLEADDTLCELADDVIDTDLYLFVVFRPLAF